jgi:23S rRNA pseudouridine1911/1915/1917 synthase
MEEEAINKHYTAIVCGKPDTSGGVIDFPVAHHPKNKKKMIAVMGKCRYRGKPRSAITSWKLRRTSGSVSEISLMIKKGARHQIRVHLAAIGMPVIGDKLYNKTAAETDIPYHLLYACGLEFITEQKQKIEIFITPPFLEDGTIGNLTSYRF